MGDWPATADAAISRHPLAEQVQARLLRDFLSGSYPPRSRIVETRLARDFGTSQAPVREALRVLEALGLVEIVPFRGARVRRPSRKELGEGFAVALALEALGVRLCVPRLTADGLAFLDEDDAEVRRAAVSKERGALLIAEARFHGRLVQMAGNSMLDRAWRLAEPFSRTHIALTLLGVEIRWPADGHRSILAAFAERDAARVVAEVGRHYAEISARVVGTRHLAASSRGPSSRS